jgi:hypothetical protein
VTSSCGGRAVHAPAIQQARPSSRRGPTADGLVLLGLPPSGGASADPINVYGGALPALDPVVLDASWAATPRTTARMGDPL